MLALYKYLDSRTVLIISIELYFLKIECRMSTDMSINFEKLNLVTTLTKSIFT